MPVLVWLAAVLIELEIQLLAGSTLSGVAPVFAGQQTIPAVAHAQIQIAASRVGIGRRVRPLLTELISGQRAPKLHNRDRYVHANFTSSRCAGLRNTLGPNPA